MKTLLFLSILSLNSLAHDFTLDSVYNCSPASSVEIDGNNVTNKDLINFEIIVKENTVELQSPEKKMVPFFWSNNMPRTIISLSRDHLYASNMGDSFQLKKLNDDSNKLVFVLHRTSMYSGKGAFGASVPISKIDGYKVNVIQGYCI